MNGPTLFDLSSVFSAVAGAVPDQDMLAWRERRLTYGEVDRRIDALVPKAFIRAPMIIRSPAGKADYRWAAALAAAHT